MKYFFLILLAFFSCTIAYCQSPDKFSAELSLFRYAPVKGMYQNQGLAPDFFPGFEVGYDVTERYKALLGVRKINSSTDMFGESSTSTGHEFWAGVEFLPAREKRLHLSYALEFFAEFTTITGKAYNDVPPHKMDINHRARFIGVAPEIKLNFRMLEGLNMVMGSRIRWGNQNLSPIGELQPAIPLVPSFQKNWLIWEPLNTLALQFEL